MIGKNQLTPESPVRNHEVLRSAYPSSKMDANNNTQMIGPGATLEKSRKLSSFVTGEMNAILFGKGHNTNIFA
ncbi:MAG: hypothetical protein HZA01_07380 [Nitrospinae bacterium]|nr:hypothetical protein [Nitrospinota bacterium]